MDEAPYQAVPETVQAASSTGARDEAKADSMLEAEKRAANAGSVNPFDKTLSEATMAV